MSAAAQEDTKEMEGFAKVIMRNLINEFSVA